MGLSVLDIWFLKLSGRLPETLFSVCLSKHLVILHMTLSPRKEFEGAYNKRMQQNKNHVTKDKEKKENRNRGNQMIRGVRPSLTMNTLRYSAHLLEVGHNVGSQLLAI